MTDSSGPSGRNHALWAGPLVAFVGLVSYWTFFLRWPALRDIPWVNLLILAAGVGLSAVGLARAWGRGVWRPALGVIGLGLSGLFTFALLWYCFSISYGLPDRESGLAVGSLLPRTVLADQTGRPFALDGDGPLLLVFYRGHW